MNEPVVPDNTAVRVALWRALHVKLDAAPHVLDDEIGLQLVAPDDGWQQRPDMDPERTKLFRASIVARARYIEDMVLKAARRGVQQYVILGAGLDTFAQRRGADSSVAVFEIDKPATQQWKRERLIQLGIGIPPSLHFVPVDFERGDDWLKLLVNAGFDKSKPAVVASTGVSMYISKEATQATMNQVATLPSGSTFAMSFILPIELVSPEVRIGMEMSQKGARESGTPFISFFESGEVVRMALRAGFKEAEYIPSIALGNEYFADRTDGLRPADHAEELLVART